MLALLAGLALVGCRPHATAAAYEVQGSLEGPYRVDRVVDGDTLRLVVPAGTRGATGANRTSLPVRLIGVDTPETKKPGEAVQPYGPEAAAYLTELLAGREVYLELDLTPYDRYERLLAYVYYPDAGGEWVTEDGRRYAQVNLAVAQSGLAQPMTIQPNSRYAGLYVAAVRAARAAERGMWAGATATGPGDCPTSGVFFSEYVEGSGNNKALEVHNATGATVDLACLRVEMYFNGAATPGFSVVLVGELPPGAAFVLWHEGAGADLRAAVESLPFSQRSGFGWFNGDDAVVLVGPDGVLDRIGTVGVEPAGGHWGREVRTKDRTLRRAAGVTTGDPEAHAPFDPAAEWVEYPRDTFDGLGLR